MKRVETSLYKYIGDIRDETFLVSPDPPVRLAFPAAYLHFESNLLGGPQAQVGLFLDRNTLKPWRYTPKGKCTLPLTDYERTLAVDINSNFLGKTSWVSPDHPTLNAAELGGPAESKPYHQVGIVDGLQFYSYDSLPRMERPIGKRHGVISGLDLDNHNYYGIPVRTDSLVKFVECNPIDANCKITFFYRGLTVNAYVDEQRIDRAQRITADLNRFIARYDLTGRAS